MAPKATRVIRAGTRHALASKDALLGFGVAGALIGIIGALLPVLVLLTTGAAAA